MVPVHRYSWLQRLVRFAGAFAGAATLLACQTSAPELDLPIAAYRDRMLAQHQAELAQDPPPDAAPRRLRREPVVEPPAGTDLPPRAAILAQPSATTQPSPEAVLSQIPDPALAGRVFQQRLEQVREEQRDNPEKRPVRNYERVVAQAVVFLDKIAMPQKVELSLAEAIRRALEHNYSIRIEAHNPAISQTQIVEAEAAFDVEFFLDTSFQNLDRAVPEGSPSGKSDIRTYQGGFRQLLPTGAATSIALSHARSANELPQGTIKTWNPAYGTNLIGDIRQPLLRGFGLDVNRAQINLRRVEYRISYDLFVQQVRDRILEVEQTYWGLVRARRIAGVLAESVSQNYATWQDMIDRLPYDATQVEVSNAESRFQSRYVNFLEAIKTVRDAEDRLKNLLNDPELKLSDPLEIIPVEVPTVAATVLDHFAEVRTALERRSEIRQAQGRIEAARIGSVVTKNAILPQLDLSFRYEVEGVGRTADNSWDDMARNHFNSFTVGAQFAYNFGERAARAAHKRAQLQESAAVTALNQVTDLIVEEMNQVIRQLMVRYDQLPPALTSVAAAERNLRALQARSQRVDPSYLETELGAVEQLSNARITLLQVVTDYNSGIAELEKAKGTLLEYNNIVVTDAKTGR